MLLDVGGVLAATNDSKHVEMQTVCTCYINTRSALNELVSMSD